MRFRVLALVFCFVFVAVPAFAQRDRLLLEPPPPIHWGVIASFSPLWETPDSLDFLLLEPMDAEFSGSEFTIGFLRGRPLGGEWGVSFVKKRVKDGSSLQRLEFDETVGQFGAEVLDDLIMRGVSAVGGEVHLFVPFATIRERVQIGLNLAGGVGTLVGHVDQHRSQGEFGPRGPPLPIPGTQRVSERTMKGVIFPEVSLVPLGKVELSVGLISGRRVKLRANGGFNYPGVQGFSVTFLYFFPRATP